MNCVGKVRGRRQIRLAERGSLESSLGHTRKGRCRVIWTLGVLGLCVVITQPTLAMETRRDGSTKGTHGTQNMSRRTLLTRYLPRRTIELAAAGPLGALLWKNVNEQGKQNVIDFGRARADHPSQAIDRFGGAHDGLAKAMVALGKEYNRAYYNAVHTWGITGFDSKGNAKYGMKTTWEWQEPEGIPKSGVISGFERRISHIQERSTLLTGPVLDTERIQEVTVTETHTGKTLQRLLSTVVFGGQAAALLGYEETLAFVRHGGRRRSDGNRYSLAQLVELDASNNQLRRRAYLKVVAGGLAAIAAFVAGRYNQSHVAKEKAHLYGQLDEMYALMKVPPEGVHGISDDQAFGDYFGNWPDMHLKGIHNFRGSLQQALDRGVENAKVRKAMQQVVAESGACMKELTPHIGGTIAPELGKRIRDGLLTTYMQNIAAAPRKPGMDIVIEGLATGLTIAGVLTAGELLNSRIATANQEAPSLLPDPSGSY